jgi:hypothetical protein
MQASSKLLSSFKASIRQASGKLQARFIQVSLKLHSSFRQASGKHQASFRQASFKLHSSFN